MSPIFATPSLSNSAFVCPTYDSSFQEDKRFTISSIEDVALKILQAKMPVEVLLNCQFNLSAFMKDQILLHKIASELQHLKTIDVASIRQTIENLPLYPELQSRIKNSALLETFYEIAFEALNESYQKANFALFFQERIFTLKNALIAIKNPEKLLPKNTKQKKEDIILHGKEFIKAALNLYLASHSYSDEESFRQNLYDLTVRLLDFVSKVAKMYLKEHKMEITNDLLNWRNPAGYNYQSHVSAPILEALLSMIGFTTELLHRKDLEPKVTLAIEHSIVCVKSPFGKSYVVDPCYRQFHEDISLFPLPTEPLLIMEKGDLDEYLDTVMMPLWKKSAQLILDDDLEAIEEAFTKDKILCLKPQIIAVCHTKPTDPESWVRNSLKKLWDEATYRRVLCNEVAEEIFRGIDAKFHATYDAIKNLEITLVNYPLESEITSDLDFMPLAKKNHPKSISLIARLNYSKKYEYIHLLDCDEGLKNVGVDVGVNAYFRSLCNIVNQEHQPKQVLYGCSGADIASVLLATDATEITMVDVTDITIDSMKEAWNDCLHNFKEVVSRLQESSFIPVFSNRMGGSSILSPDFTQFMPDLALRFFFVLIRGLRADNISIDEEDGAIKVSFDWSYNKLRFAEKRVVQFIKADITKPDEYPDRLKSILENGIDIFFMKGATITPRHYDKFIPDIDKSIKDHGFMMTTDKTMFMEDFAPNVDYPVIETEDSIQLQTLLEQDHHPLAPHPALEMYKGLRLRQCRITPADYTYWTKMVVRQKTKNRL
ncbi:MAG: hypothetical protein FJZ56_00765 [Chlamydiae bacterium]|nr:hypothetical protein [Chlamydiota bacterium]